MIKVTPPPPPPSKIPPREKTILDLCGGSGAWSEPYKQGGYDVRVITLPNNDVRFYNPPDKVYGILAAPPCTEFSLALNGHPNRMRDFSAGMEIVRACLSIIERAQLANDLKFWALENPTGHLRKFLGNPPYSFRQWWFDPEWPYHKPTDLWGRFREPKRLVFDPPSEYVDITDDIRDPAKRAITPQGFAQAFYKANR